MTDLPEKTMPPAIVYADDGTAKPRTRRPLRDPVADFAYRLRHSLRHHANARIVVADDSVTVLRMAPDGPDITAAFGDERMTLAIGPWHDDMPSTELSLRYIKMAVEGDLRVRIDRLGDRPWQFALESRGENGSWHEESALVIPRFSLWPKQKTTSYLSNRQPESRN